MNIDYDKGNGLVPVIVQHFTTGEVLMLGYGNADSMQRCADTGELWLYSRSRQALWHKGETSGNTQRVVSITADCDNDAVLMRVQPRGPSSGLFTSTAMWNSSNQRSRRARSGRQA